MGRCWVVHPVKEDLSALSAWGTTIFINSGYTYADDLEDESLPHGVIAGLDDAAQRFDFADDFLVINGDHVQQMALLAMLVTRRNLESFDEYSRVPSIRVLRYDRKADGYVAVKMP